MKPLPLIERSVLNATKSGQLVVDPFLGSGTALVAAERTGRHCYGFDLDARYCSVILERWESLTGLRGEASRGLSVNRHPNLTHHWRRRLTRHWVCLQASENSPEGLSQANLPIQKRVRFRCRWCRQVGQTRTLTHTDQQQPHYQPATSGTFRPLFRLILVQSPCPRNRLHDLPSHPEGVFRDPAPHPWALYIGGPASATTRRPARL